MSSDHRQASGSHTDRLALDQPVVRDLAQVFALSSDPRVWQHYPSGRPTAPSQSADLLTRWIDSWNVDGLGPWMARRRGETSIVGYGGCTQVAGSVWNLSYRFAASEQGRGYATELAHEAIFAAERSRPDLPVVASLLEHNLASARVAVKVGMTLDYRGPDLGNPDPEAVRLVYASRSLSPVELAALGILA